jgi:hypothetical protein
LKTSDLELLARKFPISEATRRRNQVGDLPPSSEPQRFVHHEPVAKEEGKGADPVRCKVVIVSFRKRLIDPDNLCPKYFIDALRYCGIIKDDTAKHVVIEVTQVKVKDDPRTEITVIPLEVANPNQ